MAIAAVAQITSTWSVAGNLAQCRKAIQKAVAGGAHALFLPEASDYIGRSPDESLSLCQAVHQSPFIRGLQDDAARHSLPISVGVHEPATEEDIPTTDNSASRQRIANTLLWIDSRGQITQRYQKLHLFDLDRPGAPPLTESRTTQPGSSLLPPFSSPIGKIGALICFDLRFPEASLALRRQGAEVLLYPSAFTPATGEAHWRTLLRARAIECQTYVLAAAQVGQHHETRRSYGHSLIVDPWGEVVAEASGEVEGDDDEPQVIFAEIDLELVQKTRAQLPLRRRIDVYPEV